MHKFIRAPLFVALLSGSIAAVQAQQGTQDQQGAQQQSAAQQRAQQTGTAQTERQQTGTQATQQTGTQQTGTQQTGTRQTDARTGTQQTGTRQTDAQQAGTQAQTAQQTGTQQTAAQTGPVDLNDDDRQFIQKALSSSAAEIELGQLAQRRGSSEDVREFGQMMQEHHRSAAQELAALSREHTAETAQPASEHRTKIQQLTQKQGAEFDRAYTDLMVEMHQQDVQLFEQVAQGEDYSQPVRNAAQRHLQTLRQHHQLAQQLDQDIGQVAGTDDDWMD